MMTDSPSQSLFTLAEYIMKVYAPIWFTIKIHHSCKDGSKHVFETIKKSRYLSAELKAVIDPVIQRNGYFGNPENILIAMITDNRNFIRELGLRRIMEAIARKSIGLRKFTILDFNFEAEDYHELIDWQNWEKTEPPLTIGISDEALKQIVVDGGPAEVFDFQNYPCHTHSVERCVKLVTEASAAVCGVTKRNGFIRVGLESKQLMPQFNTEAEYRE
ncbi:hypothetical protein AVEN_152916-1 [Araneus ventricosus]|uniref:Uncharacterized protein n=1 Tax=Araneus ventricosus TaxID=182803 RepID=A0A4Y2AEP5_ARAVE|nr:hypothetical protein AVEN_152916-1 [Araneus ventricosus]